MTIETEVRRIAAKVMGVDVNDHTVIATWQQITIISDEVNAELDMDISMKEAAKCKTVGDYIALVQSKH